MYLGVGMYSPHGLDSLLQRRVSFGLEAVRVVMSAPRTRERFASEERAHERETYLPGEVSVMPYVMVTSFMCISFTTRFMTSMGQGLPAK